MDTETVQHANALLASGELFPGNPLHQATMAGKPGHCPIFAPCCSRNREGYDCRCATADRVSVIVGWKRMEISTQECFPVGHPFRLDI